MEYSCYSVAVSMPTEIKTQHIHPQRDLTWTAEQGCFQIRQDSLARDITQGVSLQEENLPHNGDTGEKCGQQFINWWYAPVDCFSMEFLGSFSQNKELTLACCWGFGLCPACLECFFRFHFARRTLIWSLHRTTNFQTSLHLWGQHLFIPFLIEALGAKLTSLWWVEFIQYYCQSWLQKCWIVCCFDDWLTSMTAVCIAWHSFPMSYAIMTVIYMPHVNDHIKATICFT